MPGGHFLRSLSSGLSSSFGGRRTLLYTPTAQSLSCFTNYATKGSQPNLRRWWPSSSRLSSVLTSYYCDRSSAILQAQSFRTFFSGERKRREERNEDDTQGDRIPSKRLPPLTVFPTIVWPGFTNSIRNWFFTYFVIKPYFDREFSMQDFMQGAQEAVIHVSAKLSNGEFEDLEGLIEHETLNELKQNISGFSVAQQDLLRVTKEDVFFSFPYQVGVIIPDSPEGGGGGGGHVEGGSSPQFGPPQKRYVEITVVFHVLRGMAEMQKNNESFTIGEFTKDEENKFRVMVCNYRFFRDFTAGVKDPTWIINMVNQFLPAESHAGMS